MGFKSEKVRRPRLVAECSEGEDRRRMGILATVFADAGQVSFNIAGLGSLCQRVGVKRRTRPSPRRTRYFSTDAIARAPRAGSAAPEMTPRIGLWNRCGIRRSWRSRAAFHHQSKLCDTTRHPMLRSRIRRRIACSRHVSARWCSPRRSASRATPRGWCWKTSRATRLPFPAEPTRFIPSFQSVPINGRPWLPTARLRSRARAQCSNRVPCCSDTRGSKYDSVCPAERGPSRRNEFLEQVDITGDFKVVKTAYGSHRRSSEIRVRTPRPEADATSAGHRPQRTVVRRPAVSARVPHRGSALLGPSRLGADRGYKRRRPDGTQTVTRHDRQGSIEQPAVEHNIHRPIRCGDLKRTKNVIQCFVTVVSHPRSAPR